MDVIFPTVELREGWHGALVFLAKETAKSDPKILIKQKWTAADKRGDGVLGMKELVVLLKDLGLNLSKKVIKKYGSASYLDLLDVTDFGDVLLKRTLKKVINRGFIKHHSAEDNLFEHYTTTTPHAIK